MDIVNIAAYAKINTFLTVTGRRADGYHTILSHMARISLSDRLSLKRTNGRGVSLCCTGGSEDIPTDGKNLAYRAATAFLDAAGLQTGVSIDLEKHIPSGAGLGGGSADAGAVLLGLNALFDLPLPRKKLYDLALPLGADVPFMIRADTCSAATARGIGEVLTPAVPLPAGYTLVIAKPQGSVSTPAAYRRLDEIGLTGSPEDEEAYARLESALASGNLAAVGRASRNDFEKAVVSDCPGVGELLALFPQEGAVFARMSGSGSAVAGWFEDKTDAENCVRKLRKEPWISFAATAEIF